MTHFPANDELARLGMPFPLYKAPLRTVAGVLGPGVCSLDGQEHEHRFELGIGSRVILPCPRCGEQVPLDAADSRPGACHRCGEFVRFPPVHEGEDALAVCYSCLQDGRAAFTHATEFGMVRWEDAVAGLTHGVPYLEKRSLGNNAFELGPPHEPETEWRGVYVPSQLLMELVRTPNYISWQDSTWFFHCNQIMSYLGEWLPADFERARPADPRSLFKEMTDHGPHWEQEWALIGTDIASCYVHGCRTCGTLRSFVAMD